MPGYKLYMVHYKLYPSFVFLLEKTSVNSSVCHRWHNSGDIREILGKDFHKIFDLIDLQCQAFPELGQS